MQGMHLIPSLYGFSNPRFQLFKMDFFPIISSYHETRKVIELIRTPSVNG